MISEALRKDAFSWCSKFLGGTWAKCPEEKFRIKLFPGGLTNYIYICELDNSLPVEEHELRRVMLRIYGEINGPHEKFYELLIFNMLSERKLGPRLLGAFKRGRIEEYIESRTLTVFDLRNCTFLPQIAMKMAQFHVMDTPFTKKPTFVTRNVSKWLPYYSKAIEEKDTFPLRAKNIIEECIEMNIMKELESMEAQLTKTQSTVVFCHNDVQEANLLIRTGVDGRPSSSDITMIDYEYSYYGYRGYDIGNHFCEWVFQNVADNELGFAYDFNSYPDSEQQMKFARAYIDALVYELKSGPESKRRYFLTSPERLITEANIYSLQSHLFWGIWGFAQKYLSHIDFDFLEYSIVRFRAYFHFKKKFSQYLDK